MSSTTSNKADTPPTYGNWRKPRTPGLPGLGLFGTAVALGGLALAVLAQMVGGWRAAVVCASIDVVIVLPLLYKNRSGRNGWQALTARVMWFVGRRRGQNVYRASAVRSPGRQGRSTLPGLLARSTLYDCIDSYGQPFAMLHVPATRHYSVIIQTDPQGSELVDPETTDTWVALWGRWLAELSREPHLEAASATVETAPDPGSRLAQEINTLDTDNAPDLARAMLHEARDTYQRGSPQVSGRVALTYNATRRLVEDRELFAGKRRGKKRRRSAVMSPREMAEQIGSRLPGLIRELGGTGAGGGCRAMSSGEVAELVRLAYDPAIAADLDALRAYGQESGITWANAGPVAQDEDWDALRHDSGTSITWQMVEPPRGAVQPQVLLSLLEALEGLTRKRITILYRPHDPAAAARIADSDVRTAIGRATTRKGENRAGDVLELAAARQAAAEEAGGAGLIRFGLLATATVTDPDDLPHVADLIDQAAGASRIQVRRVYAGQSAAFTAALGLGLVLSKHVAVPDIFRQYL